jgi:rhodanese-related sulfurtransferase/DNA-binding transcriptional ArsR family regulator
MGTNEEDNGRARLLEHFARIGRAMGSPGRLALLELLSQGEKTVEALATESGMRVGNTSAHLRALRKSELVETRREGVYVYYRLADDSVEAHLLSLHAVAERRLPEVRAVVARHFAEPAEAIAPAELVKRVHAGEWVLLDVRPAEEYRQAHAAGARWIPLAELAGRVDELPPDRRIAIFCRGRYSPLSVRAVALLRGRGFDAVRLGMGMAEWRAAGLPVEREGERSR